MCCKGDYGRKNKGYEESLTLLNLKDLAVRRENLCLEFAKKMLSEPQNHVMVGDKPPQRVQRSLINFPQNRPNIEG